MVILDVVIVMARRDDKVSSTDNSEEQQQMPSESTLSHYKAVGIEHWEGLKDWAVSQR